MGLPWKALVLIPAERRAVAVEVPWPGCRSTCGSWPPASTSTPTRTASPAGREDPGLLHWRQSSGGRGHDDHHATEFLPGIMLPSRTC